jgi:hypothetical protein
MVGLWATLVVALGVGLVGCSGTSSSEDEDEDDGSGQPAKLGLYVFIRNPSDPAVAGLQCPASSGIEWDIGAPVKTGGMIVDVDSPTPTDFGSTLADGVADTQISCSVTAGGAITAVGSGIDPIITPPNGNINFTISGTAAQNGTAQTNTFDLELYTPVTIGLASSQTLPGCSFTAVHQQDPGALWADFTCPALVAEGNPAVGCQANGTIVIEYCETE